MRIDTGTDLLTEHLTRVNRDQETTLDIATIDRTTDASKVTAGEEVLVLQEVGRDREETANASYATKEDTSSANARSTL